MSDIQLVCVLFAAPFLTLSLAWLIGLSILSRAEARVRSRKNGGR